MLIDSSVAKKSRRRQSGLFLESLLPRKSMLLWSCLHLILYTFGVRRNGIADAKRLSDSEADALRSLRRIFQHRAGNGLESRLEEASKSRGTRKRSSNKSSFNLKNVSNMSKADLEEDPEAKVDFPDATKYTPDLYIDNKWIKRNEKLSVDTQVNSLTGNTTIEKECLVKVKEYNKKFDNKPASNSSNSSSETAEDFTDASHVDTSAMSAYEMLRYVRRTLYYDGVKNTLNMEKSVYRARKAGREWVPPSALNIDLPTASMYKRFKEDDGPDPHPAQSEEAEPNSIK
eukprot:TRINITY_DN31479_c0_g1_i1.p1 TRINITY_DN31479_c0_g1~~TRINITY_DN31479_c0_g1_i1.p1  ORF type:complete len:287 (+),score=39.80 TRINITY_DN31479_c0_g1_i1:74-934(+)